MKYEFTTDRLADKDEGRFMKHMASMFGWGGLTYDRRVDGVVTIRSDDEDCILAARLAR